GEETVGGRYHRLPRGGDYRLIEVVRHGSECQSAERGGISPVETARRERFAGPEGGCAQILPVGILTGGCKQFRRGPIEFVGYIVVVIRTAAGHPVLDRRVKLRVLLGCRIGLLRRP